MQNMTRMLISAAALYLGLTAAAGAYYVPMRPGTVVPEHYVRD